MPARPDNADFFLKKEYVLALLGANNNRYTEAFHLFFDIQDLGYTILPISEKERTVGGKPAFPNVQSARPFIDVCIFAFDNDEEHIMESLTHMRDMNITKALFLPERMSSEAEKFCEDHFFDYMEGNLRDIVKKMKQKTSSATEELEKYF